MLKFLQKSQGALVAILFFALYAYTAQRGLSWQDSGLHQLRIFYRETESPFGLACAHPLYIIVSHFLGGLIGQLFSIEIPNAVNILSGFWMALALFVVHRIVLRVTGSRMGALNAMLALGGAHIVWWLSTIAESYTMVLFFLACEIDCVLRFLDDDRPFCSLTGVAIASGFGFATHNLALLSLPVSLIFIIRHAYEKRRRVSYADFWGTVVWFVVVWVSCARPILSLAINEYLSLGSFQQVLQSLLFGDYKSDVTAIGFVPSKRMAVNLLMAAFSLCNFAIVFAFVKSVRSLCFSKVKFSFSQWYLLTVFLVHFIFFVRYPIADQVLFALPSLMIAVLLLAKRIAELRRGYLLAVYSLLTMVCFPLLADNVLHLPIVSEKIIAVKGRTLPFRDEIRYWTLPWKHNETSAEDFAYTAVAIMDEVGGSLYVDSTSAPPVMFAMMERTVPWRLYTPWTDCSQFIRDAKRGEENLYATTPQEGYCPVDALESGAVKAVIPFE